MKENNMEPEFMFHIRGILFTAGSVNAGVIIFLIRYCVITGYY